MLVNNLSRWVKEFSSRNEKKILGQWYHSQFWTTKPYSKGSWPVIYFISDSRMWVKCCIKLKIALVMEMTIHENKLYIYKTEFLTHLKLIWILLCSKVEKCHKVNLSWIYFEIVYRGQFLPYIVCAIPFDLEFEARIK